MATAMRMATDTKPVSQLMAEMADLKAIERSLDTSTESSDPVLQVQLSPDEIQQVLYQAKWHKWQRQRQLLVQQVHEWNVAFFTQPWTADRFREYIEWKAAAYRFKDGSGFLIDADNEKVIQALCLYFTNDPRFAAYGKQHFDCDNWSLEKAILLRGPSGGGKTTVMELFSANPKMSFDIIPAQFIRNRVKEVGDRALGDFLLGRPEPAGNYKCFYQTRIANCIDDFGAEDHVYGTSVMQKYIETAYALKKFPWYLRHLTSMLRADEYEQKYGYHVKSRMREMYNDVFLEGPDRRK